MCKIHEKAKKVEEYEKFVEYWISLNQNTKKKCLNLKAKYFLKILFIELFSGFLESWYYIFLITFFRIFPKKISVIFSKNILSLFYLFWPQHNINKFAVVFSYIIKNIHCEFKMKIKKNNLRDSNHDPISLHCPKQPDNHSKFLQN